VHESVGVSSRDFQHKLRRSNYVTPTNYLDFIYTYLRLLEEKDKFILNQVESINNNNNTNTTNNNVLWLTEKRAGLAQCFSVLQGTVWTSG